MKVIVVITGIVFVGKLYFATNLILKNGRVIKNKSIHSSVNNYLFQIIHFKNEFQAHDQE